MSEFSARLQERIANSQFGVSAVAKLAGISRQTIYNLLQPDFDPINPSVRKVARALGVDPLDLIPRQDDVTESASKVMDILCAAANRKESRAFEVLPALLTDTDPRVLLSIRPSNDSETRVLGAALAMAAELAGREDLNSLAKAIERLEDPNNAIFFGKLPLDPVTIIESTPKPLHKHRVFGSFTEELFMRHFEKD